MLSATRMRGLNIHWILTCTLSCSHEVSTHMRRYSINNFFWYNNHFPPCHQWQVQPSSYTTSLYKFKCPYLKWEHEVGRKGKYASDKQTSNSFIKILQNSSNVDHEENSLLRLFIYKYLDMMMLSRIFWQYINVRQIQPTIYKIGIWSLHVENKTP